MSRTAERKNDSVELRLVQLETDADKGEERFNELRVTLDKMDERQSRMLWVMIGILVTTTGGALLIAANLVVIQ